jgi:site-specific DNA-methyltransferase (adenine-specific)
LSNTSEFTNYPTQVIEITNGERGLHPTQKPVELFEYLIRTYTDENAIVLDNTAGSGTTAIAAINTNRRWICIEREKEYYEKAIERITDHGKTRT